MAIETSKVEIAGGSKGWGGLVKREDRMGLLPNQASDLLNVWDDNGVLRKRRGHTSFNSYFRKVADYDTTKTGSEYVKRSTPITQLAQEITLGTSNGGWAAGITGSALDLLIEIKAKLFDGGGTAQFYLELRPDDGTGQPDENVSYGTSKGTVGFMEPSAEGWLSFYFADVTLAASTFFVVLRQTNATNDTAYWAYGADVFGTEKAMKYESSAWAEIASVDFMLKVHQQYNSFAPITVDHIEKYSDGIDFMTTLYLENDKHGAQIMEANYPKNMSDYIGATIFIEGEEVAYKIESAADNSPYMHISPPCQSATSTTKTAYITTKKALYQVSDKLIENHFNSWSVQIDVLSTIYGEINIAHGWKAGAGTIVAIASQNKLSGNAFTPQIWGTAAAPFTGPPGDASFTGLTNPITDAEVVMYHKDHLIWGGVTINGTEYKDRIYYSGQGTPESGYDDNRYDILDGKLTAMKSLGDTAIICTTKTIYIMFGDYFENFELDKIGRGAKVPKSQSLCTANIDGIVYAYALSSSGMVKIEQNKVSKISDPISKELEGLDLDRGGCWYDGTKKQIIFSATDGGDYGTIYTYGYKPMENSWWKYDTPYNNGGWFPLAIDRDGKTYGMTWGTKGFYDFDTQADDVSTAINAYYKTAPFYAAGGGNFNPSVIWVLARNEEVASNLTLDMINDYVATQKTIALRNTSFPDNAPVSHQEYNTNNDVNSIEVKISQNTADENFAVSSIFMDAEGGQNVDQTV